MEGRVDCYISLEVKTGSSFIRVWLQCRFNVDIIEVRWRVNNTAGENVGYLTQFNVLF